MEPLTKEHDDILQKPNMAKIEKYFLFDLCDIKAKDLCYIRHTIQAFIVFLNHINFFLKKLPSDSGYTPRDTVLDVILILSDRLLQYAVSNQGEKK